MDVEKTIKERVEAERKAHQERDVLAESYRLKDLFSHVKNYPSKLRLENLLYSYTKDLSGKTILDYGCGRGEASLKYLASGGTVFGIDIAENYIEAALASANNTKYSTNSYTFKVMDAHDLQFDNNCFDFVVGNGILHHLNADKALSEIFRVLKPGGRVLMYEPLAGNPLLKIFRIFTPNARTDDERPFTASDIANFCDDKKWHSEVAYCGIIEAPVAAITSVLMRNRPDNWFLKVGDKIESWVHKKGFLNSWNQYILFNLVKKS